MPAREGAKIFHDGEEVGTVTSGRFGPSLSAPIAMAYVHAALAEPGTKVEIEVRGTRLAATVTPMPFVPHRYHRPGTHTCTAIPQMTMNRPTSRGNSQL